MNSDSKLARIFIVTFMITTASWSLAFVMSAFAGEKPFPEATLKKAGQRVVEGKPIEEKMNQSIDGIDKINITVRNSDVELIATEDKELKVEFEGTVEQKDNVKILEIKRDGSELSVETNKSAQSTMFFGYLENGGKFSFGATQFLHLKVYVPKTYGKKISIAAASGDITVNDQKLEELVIKSASGDISLKNSQAAVAQIKSASGDQKIMKFTGDLSIASASGEVEVKEQKGGSLEVSVASGDIDLEKIDVKSIVAKATSGDVTIDVTDKSGWTFKLRALSGEVDNNLTENDKGDKTMKVDSLSGDIKIKR